MHATNVIKRPLITEKSTYSSAEFNRFAFEVDRRATKTDIKRAVEELYEVRVLGVATQMRKGRVRRYRYGYVEGRGFKKAIVKVHPDDQIELF